MTYRLTFHAYSRIKERAISVEECLAALEGRRILRENGYLYLVDPGSHCALIVEPQTNLIVTVVRLLPAHYKHICSVEKRKRTYV